MPEFEFRATGRTGETVTREALRSQPGGAGRDPAPRPIIPSRIVEKGREIAIPKPKIAGKVSPKELAVFTRQFSVMIDAGLPLVQCLEILATAQENKAFAKALAAVRESVEAAPRWPTACGYSRKSGIRFTATWWRRVKPAVFWTPSCSGSRATLKRPSNSSAPCSPL